MQKVVEEKTHQRRSINKSNCLADYIPGLSLPRARSSPTRQKQKKTIMATATLLWLLEFMNLVRALDGF